MYGDGNRTCTLVWKFYKKGLVGHQTMQAIVTDMRKLGNVRVRENTCMKKTSRQSVYTTPIPKSMNKMEPKKVNPSKLLNIKLARSAIHTNLLKIAGNCHKTKQKPHKHILCN